MDTSTLRELLAELQHGSIDIEQVVRRIRLAPYEDLGFAKVDHHRELRHGMPEVILGQGKTPDEVRAISEKLLERSPNLLVTRASEAMYEAVRELSDQAEHFPRSGAVRVWAERSKLGKAKIAVVCAGTSDIPVAEEDLQPYDLYTADEAFISNTPSCLLPMTKVDHRQIGDGKPGPITRQLLAAWSEWVGVDIVGQMESLDSR